MFVATCDMSGRTFGWNFLVNEYVWCFLVNHWGESEVGVSVHRTKTSPCGSEVDLMEYWMILFQ